MDIFYCSNCKNGKGGTARHAYEGTNAYGEEVYTCLACGKTKTKVKKRPLPAVACLYRVVRTAAVGVLVPGHLAAWH
jgi:hypothetical protein